MSSLNKHKLVFNPNMPNTCSDNIGVYLRDGYGQQLTSTDVDGYVHALDVFMNGFAPAISNEDGYLYVDFSNDLLSPDGYLNVNLAGPLVVNVDNNFEHAEDFGHVSGDIGSFALGVRNDLNAVMTSDNFDYSAFAVDAYGMIKTHTYFDSTLLNEDGYLYVDFSPDLLNPDGYLNINVAGGLLSVVIAAEHAEDFGHVSGDIGSFALGVRNDLNAVMTSDNFDYSAFAVDAYGMIKTHTYFDSSLLSPDGYLNVNLAAPVVVDVDNNFEHAEDFGHVSGDIGSFSLAVRRDALAAGAFTSDDADYAGFNVDAYGALWSDSVGSKFDGQADNGTMAEDRALKIGARTFDGPLAFVGSDMRVDLASDSYRRLYINDSPNVALLVTPNSVGTSAELLVSSALGGRRRMLIQNTSDCAIYAGHDSSVSSANGFIIPGGDTLALEIGDGLDLWVIADEPSTDVRVMELA